MSLEIVRFDGFNAHSRLDGSHAFLSPSNYHWLNYPPDKLLERLRTAQAASEGTELHLLAALNIKHGTKLMETDENKTLWLYVNDCIRFGMSPEQTLFYSMNCYGTADAIGFAPNEDGEKYAGYLRISDLKTGLTKASDKQLYIYAGLFCLEYGYLPYEIEGELTIYQNGHRNITLIDRNFLAFVYDKIQTSHETIENSKGGLL
jgi:hypothetical protein